MKLKRTKKPRTKEQSKARRAAKQRNAKIIKSHRDILGIGNLRRAWKGVLTRPKVCFQTKIECLVMCRAASEVKGIIVEIGRAKGGSLALMSIASPLSKIYSIDISNENKRTALKTCKKYKVSRDRYEMITGDSAVVAEKLNKDVDLLFIDGDHSEEGVYRDLISWVKYVKKGSIIMAHDYYPVKHIRRKEVGPYDAITKYILKYKNVKFERLVHKMAFLRKIA